MQDFGGWFQQMCANATPVTDCAAVGTPSAKLLFDDALMPLGAQSIIYQLLALRNQLAEAIVRESVTAETNGASDAGSVKPAPPTVESIRSSITDLVERLVVWHRAQQSLIEQHKARTSPPTCEV